MVKKEMAIVLVLVLSVVIPSVTSTVNDQPVAMASISPIRVYACENTMVTLDASDSYDLDLKGKVVKFQWLYNNNLLASGERVTLDLAKKFNDDPGTYPITLNVTDNGGATHTTKIDFHVKNNPRPQVKEVVWERKNNDDDKDWLTKGDQFPVEVTLASGNYGKIIYDWTYDHEVFFLHSQKIERDGIVARFEVIEIGWKTSYKIGVVVSNACGERDERKKEVEVEIKSSRLNSPPKAQILLPLVIKEGESFYPESRSTTKQSGNEIVDWYWEIIDEQETAVATSPREYPRFRIEDSGNYNISLTVTDYFRATGKITEVINVKENENDPPVVDASATKKVAIYGKPFELNASFSWDPDDKRNPKEVIGKYLWWDETYGELLSKPNQLKNPVCVVMFNRTGLHKIRLTVIDTGFPDPLDNSTEFEITVIEPPAPTVSPTPIATYTPAPTSKPTLVQPTLIPTETPLPTKTPASSLEIIWEKAKNFISTLLNL